MAETYGYLKGGTIPSWNSSNDSGFIGYDGTVWMVVYLVTDTWNQFNGITRIYKSFVDVFAGRYPAHRLVVIYPDKADTATWIKPNVVLVGHHPRLWMRLPQYNELVAAYPRRRFWKATIQTYGVPSVCHLATQGLFCYSARRFFARRAVPMIGFYHTDWPRFLEMYARANKTNRARRLAGRTASAFGKAWDRAVYGGCERVITHTRAVGSELQDRLSHNLDYIDEFLPEDLFTPRDEAPLHRPMNFGFVGRLAVEKRIAMLAQQFAESRDSAKLHVIGDGPIRNELPAGDNIVFHGYLSGPALVSAYKQLDFNLVPCRAETLNMTLIEAAACGVPSVAEKNTAPAEVIEQFQCGLVIDSFESPDWREKVRAVHEDAYRVMVQNCRRLAQCHSVTVGTQKIVQIWERNQLSA